MFKKSRIKGLLTSTIKNMKFFFKVLRRNKVSLAGFLIVFAFIVMATVGPEVVPYVRDVDIKKRFLPPSLEHPLGTDYAGRDTFAQIVHGSRDVLIVAFLTAVFTTIVSFVIGITSGFIGGKIDAVLMTFADIFLTIPSFPLLIIIVTSLQKILSVVEIAAILSIVGWPALARAIRSQVLSIKEREFIESVVCLGLSKIHILFGEILPNLLPYIFMNLILSTIGAIYSQVGLYFIGALPFTATNWGVMIQTAINQGALVNPRVWWYLLSPLACIILIQAGFILFMHALEEIFNPRLRTEA
ncbi:MAG: ABC transporter permease [Candidatus Bathyarchaeia archaeon]